MWGLQGHRIGLSPLPTLSRALLQGNFPPVGNRSNVLVSSCAMKGEISEQLWSHLVMYILLISWLHSWNMVCRRNFVNCPIHSHRKATQPFLCTTPQEYVQTSLTWFRPDCGIISCQEDSWRPLKLHYTNNAGWLGLCDRLIGLLIKAELNAAVISSLHSP